MDMTTERRTGKQYVTSAAAAAAASECLHAIAPHGRSTNEMLSAKCRRRCDTDPHCCPAALTFHNIETMQKIFPTILSRSLWYLKYVFFRVYFSDITILLSTATRVFCNV